MCCCCCFFVLFFLFINPSRKSLLSDMHFIIVDLTFAKLRYKESFGFTAGRLFWLKQMIAELVEVRSRSF
jgi:hypothetical protein